MDALNSWQALLDTLGAQDKQQHHATPKTAESHITAATRTAAAVKVTPGSRTPEYYYTPQASSPSAHPAATPVDAWYSIISTLQGAPSEGRPRLHHVGSPGHSSSSSPKAYSAGSSPGMVRQLFQETAQRGHGHSRLAAVSNATAQPPSPVSSSSPQLAAAAASAKQLESRLDDLRTSAEQLRGQLGDNRAGRGTNSTKAWIHQEQPMRQPSTSRQGSKHGSSVTHVPSTAGGANPTKSRSSGPSSKQKHATPLSRKLFTSPHKSLSPLRHASNATAAAVARQQPDSPGRLTMSSPIVFQQPVPQRSHNNSSRMAAATSDVSCIGRTVDAPHSRLDTITNAAQDNRLQELSDVQRPDQLTNALHKMDVLLQAVKQQHVGDSIQQQQPQPQQQLPIAADLTAQLAQLMLQVSTVAVTPSGQQPGQQCVQHETPPLLGTSTQAAVLLQQQQLMLQLLLQQQQLLQHQQKQQVSEQTGKHVQQLCKMDYDSNSVDNTMHGQANQRAIAVAAANASTSEHSSSSSTPTAGKWGAKSRASLAQQTVTQQSTEAAAAANQGGGSGLGKQADKSSAAAAVSPASPSRPHSSPVSRSGSYAQRLQQQQQQQQSSTVSRSDGASGAAGNTAATAKLRRQWTVPTAHTAAVNTGVIAATPAHDSTSSTSVLSQPSSSAVKQDCPVPSVPNEQQILELPGQADLRRHSSSSSIATAEDVPIVSKLQRATCKASSLVGGELNDGRRLTGDSSNATTLQQQQQQQQQQPLRKKWSSLGAAVPSRIPQAPGISTAAAGRSNGSAAAAAPTATLKRSATDVTTAAADGVFGQWLAATAAVAKSSSHEDLEQTGRRGSSSDGIIQEAATAARQDAGDNAAAVDPNKQQTVSSSINRGLHRNSSSRRTSSLGLPEVVKFSGGSSSSNSKVGSSEVSSISITPASCTEAPAQQLTDESSRASSIFSGHLISREIGSVQSSTPGIGIFSGLNSCNPSLFGSPVQTATAVSTAAAAAVQAATLPSIAEDVHSAVTVGGLCDTMSRSGSSSISLGALGSMSHPEHSSAVSGTAASAGATKGSTAAEQSSSSAHATFSQQQQQQMQQEESQQGLDAASEDQPVGLSTPAAAIPRVHTPGKSATAVAAETVTPMLANSTAAVLQMTEAWRQESGNAQARWKQLLEEWSADDLLDSSKEGSASLLAGQHTSYLIRRSENGCAGTAGNSQPMAAAESAAAAAAVTSQDAGSSAGSGMSLLERSNVESGNVGLNATATAAAVDSSVEAAEMHVHGAAGAVAHEKHQLLDHDQTALTVETSRQQQQQCGAAAVGSAADEASPVTARQLFVGGSEDSSPEELELQLGQLPGEQQQQHSMGYMSLGEQVAAVAKTVLPEKESAADSITAHSKNDMPEYDQNRGQATAAKADCTAADTRTVLAAEYAADAGSSAVIVTPEAADDVLDDTEMGVIQVETAATDLADTAATSEADVTCQVPAASSSVASARRSADGERLAVLPAAAAGLLVDNAAAAPSELHLPADMAAPQAAMSVSQVQDIAAAAAAQQETSVSSHSAAAAAAIAQQATVLTQPTTSEAMRAEAAAHEAATVQGHVQMPPAASPGTAAQAVAAAAAALQAAAAAAPEVEDSFSQLLQGLQDVHDRLAALREPSKSKTATAAAATDGDSTRPSSGKQASDIGMNRNTRRSSSGITTEAAGYATATAVMPAVSAAAVDAAAAGTPQTASWPISQLQPLTAATTPAAAAAYLTPPPMQPVTASWAGAAAAGAASGVAVSKQTSADKRFAELRKRLQESRAALEAIKTPGTTTTAAAVDTGAAATVQQRTPYTGGLAAVTGAAACSPLPLAASTWLQSTPLQQLLRHTRTKQRMAPSATAAAAASSSGSSSKHVSRTAQSQQQQQQQGVSSVQLLVDKWRAAATERSRPAGSSMTTAAAAATTAHGAGGLRWQQSQVPPTHGGKTPAATLAAARTPTAAAAASPLWMQHGLAETPFSTAAAAATSPYELLFPMSPLLTDASGVTTAAAAGGGTYGGSTTSTTAAAARGLTPVAFGFGSHNSSSGGSRSQASSRLHNLPGSSTDHTAFLATPFEFSTHTVSRGNIGPDTSPIAFSALLGSQQQQQQWHALGSAAGTARSASPPPSTAVLQQWVRHGSPTRQLKQQMRTAAARQQHRGKQQIDNQQQQQLADDHEALDSIEKCRAAIQSATAAAAAALSWPAAETQPHYSGTPGAATAAASSWHESDHKGSERDVWKGSSAAARSSPAAVLAATAAAAEDAAAALAVAPAVSACNRLKVARLQQAAATAGMMYQQLQQ